MTPTKLPRLYGYRRLVVLGVVVAVSTALSVIGTLDSGDLALVLVAVVGSHGASKVAERVGRRRDEEIL